jgi:hypothetical protein
MNKIVFVALSLTIGLILMQYAHGQINQTETGSFFRCYTSFSSFLLLSNQLTPATVNLTDPQVKTFIKNTCNFYHEKTGKWIDILSFNAVDIDAKVIEEFNQKYGSSMPESLKEFMNMSILK